MTFDLSAVNLRKIPATAALLEQKTASFDLVDGWLYEQLQSGCVSEGRDVRQTEVPVSELYRDFQRYADSIGVKRRPSPREFAQRLARKLPSFGRKRPWREVLDQHGLTVMDGDEPRLRHVRCYVLPALEDCREAFEAAVQQPITCEGT
jgi:hypothetical protein